MKQLNILNLVLGFVLGLGFFYLLSHGFDSSETKNKTIVKDFYEGVFVKHEVADYSDKYIGDIYIQHNPYLADGKKPFVAYFTKYFTDHPDAKNSIKKMIADKDLVVLQVHSTKNKNDKGQAIIDIFRLKNNKIVEHWDVVQSIPVSSNNGNTMF
ncbi:MAG: ester cyclase [Neisseriaceae bacterium]